MLIIPHSILETIPPQQDTTQDPMVYAKMDTDIGWEYYVLSYYKPNKLFHVYALPDHEKMRLSYDDLVKIELQYGTEVEFDYDFIPQPLQEVIDANR